MGGKNLSPPLAWNGARSGVKSFALSIVDLHPIANNWLHWCVINIPPDVTAFAEGASGGAMPPGATELYNSFGERGYGGPHPPKGSGPHSYEFTLYALGTEAVDLSANSSLSAFRRTVQAHVLDTARLTGVYER